MEIESKDTKIEKISEEFRKIIKFNYNLQKNIAKIPRNILNRRNKKLQQVNLY